MKTIKVRETVEYNLEVPDDWNGKPSNHKIDTEDKNFLRYYDSVFNLEFIGKSSLDGRRGSVPYNIKELKFNVVGTEKITKAILSGFEIEKERFKLDYGKYRIIIGPGIHNDYFCTIEIPEEKCVIASLEVNTVSDFNKFMDLLDINFRLKK